MRAATSLTRVDPVYLAESAGAVVVSDRASWAAAVTGRLDNHDPVMIGAFLSLGYVRARLVNRAGRWSAAARQAYLLRSALVQPLFADRVVRAARAVPLRHRMSDRLHRDVLAMLCSRAGRAYRWRAALAGRAAHPGERAAAPGGRR